MVRKTSHCGQAFHRPDPQTASQHNGKDPKIRRTTMKTSKLINALQDLGVLTMIIVMLLLMPQLVNA
jgi:hypothetical protein